MDESSSEETTECRTDEDYSYMVMSLALQICGFYKFDIPSVVNGDDKPSEKQNINDKLMMCVNNKYVVGFIILQSKTHWVNYKRARNLAHLSQCELSIERMDKIKSHADTEKIKYSKSSKYKNAFEYVDELFPNADVKNVTIYRVAKSCLDRVGLQKIGGCYDKISRIVVISKGLNFSPKEKDKTWSTIKAKVTADEVIVHELLHYVSMYNSGDARSMDIEEEFAYGNSIGYLRSKGHSDDEIIMNNFLPYFIQSVDQRKIARKILVENGYVVEEVIVKSEKTQKAIFKKLDKSFFKESRKIAIEKAKTLIEIYSEDVSSNKEVEDNRGSKFGTMDFGF